MLEEINVRYCQFDVKDGKIVRHRFKKEVYSENFDDKNTKLKLTKVRIEYSLHKIATMIKRRVTFYSLFEASDELELLQIQHKLLKE